MIEIMILPFPLSNLKRTGRTKLHLKKNEALFRQGDITTAIFFVISGAVHLVRHTHEGHSVILHRAVSGTTFAEASLFSDVYHCDATATEPAEVIRLSKTDILALVTADPDFAQALLKRFAQDVQTHRKHLEILAIKGAEDRVFAALVSFGQSGTVTAFAIFVGLTTEATLRALSKLVQQGKVTKLKRGHYEVPDTSITPRSVTIKSSV